MGFTQPFTERVNDPRITVPTDSSSRWSAAEANSIRDCLLELQDHVTGWVNVKSEPYGAVGDGVADDTAALQAFRDYLAANPGKRGVIPAGTYCYSVSPNWAVDNLHVECVGEVRFRYTGTGNALIFDAGASAQVFGLRFGRVIVEAPSSAQDGIYVRAVHHSIIDARVRGAGTNYMGLRVEFAVCTRFPNIEVSDQTGWYLSARPKHGILLTERQAGEPTSYCLFDNPVIEYTSDTGIHLESALGCVFVGGTSEGNGKRGLTIAATSSNNRFLGTDFEDNPVGGGKGDFRGAYNAGTTYATNEYSEYAGEQYLSLQSANTAHQPDISPTWWKKMGYDIVVAGFENEFHGVDSNGYVLVSGAASKRNLFVGGSAHIIALSGGATQNAFRDVRYNRSGANGWAAAGGALYDNYAGNAFPGTYDARIGPLVHTQGVGSPEGVVTAPIGSVFLRTDGGATTTLYVKTSGAGNTGWTAK